MRRIAWAGCAVFVLFSLLQLNDPDPLAWVVLYGLTAVYSAMVALGWMRPSPVLGWGMLAGSMGVVTLLFVEPSKDPMGPSWMGPLASEGVREGLGLLVVAAWSGWLAWASARSPSPTKLE